MSKLIIILFVIVFAFPACAAVPAFYDSFMLTFLGQGNSQMAVGVGLIRAGTKNFGLSAKYYGYSEILPANLVTYHSLELNCELTLFPRGSKAVNPYFGGGIGYLFDSRTNNISMSSVYIPCYIGVDFLMPYAYSSIFIECESVRDKRIYSFGWRVPDLITAFYGVN